MNWLRSISLVFLGLGIGIIATSRFSFHVLPETQASQEQSETALSDDTTTSEISEEPQSSTTLDVTTTTAPALSPATLKLKEEFDQYFGVGDLDKANQVLGQLAKIAPQSTVYLEGQVSVAMRVQDWDKAKIAIKECLDQLPTSKNCLVSDTNIQLLLGSNEEQQKSIQSCMQAHPQDLQCRNSYATYAFMHSEYQTALNLYLGILQDNGAYGTTFEISYLNYQIGLAYRGLGKEQEAAQYLRSACDQGYPSACEEDFDDE
jgi:tetratricopeptide (TPR) repeat protein